jgi:hypothetical protein
MSRVAHLLDDLCDKVVGRRGSITTVRDNGGSDFCNGGRTKMEESVKKMSGAEQFQRLRMTFHHPLAKTLTSF